MKQEMFNAFDLLILYLNGFVIQEPIPDYCYVYL